MVYGFVIHTVGAEPCRVLYQRLFSCGGRPAAEDDVLEKETVSRKERAAAVAGLVQAQCLLRRQVSPRVELHPSEEVVIQEEDVGVLGLPPGAPFPQELLVLWVGVHALGFSLICDPRENLTLAELTLRMMVKHLLEALRLLSHSSSAVLRADKLELALDKFLPQGALLFLSHPAAQALEKELSSCVTL